MPQPLRHKGNALIEGGAVATLVNRATQHIQLATLQDFYSGDESQQAGLTRTIGANQTAATADRQTKTHIL